ncbi:hypothetical protein IEQ34_004218 [Dendrobium chrysotoxum]|uniref:Uncharacterized protein n=1 Tax=Dendrobium chrysotoxum TaxID=161865 RepID=A0AAV7GYU4_DENCH|nr:hypothetical protein IEQ34_004218 [Dendrobium chrysotoxum]
MSKQEQNSTSSVKKTPSPQPQSLRPPEFSAGDSSEAAWKVGKYPNPPDSVNPDPATLLDGIPKPGAQLYLPASPFSPSVGSSRAPIPSPPSLRNLLMMNTLRPLLRPPLTQTNEIQSSATAHYEPTLDQQT